jgi:hypothetical protein
VLSVSLYAFSAATSYIYCPELQVWAGRNGSFCTKGNDWANQHDFAKLLSV